MEDEPKLAAAVKEGLEAEQHSVNIAPTGEEGFFLAQTQSFDLLIFDIMLPGRDGIEIVGNLRRLGHRTPILLLTSKDAVDDRVQGLDAGADDYLEAVCLFGVAGARAGTGAPEPAGNRSDAQGGRS